MTIKRAKNIFINCPYDGAYIPTLRPVLFTVKLLGFCPRLAIESGDSGSTRIDKILALINNSRYAIHDLSRLRANRRGEHFRMNMPFELGLDIGCRVFGKKEQKKKKCLVLESDKYSIQVALSDLSNSDVCAHKDNPEIAVRHVRNWLVQEANVPAPSGTAIWYAYNDFVAYLDKHLRDRRFRKIDITSMPLPELLSHMTTWIKQKGRIYYKSHGIN